MTAPDEKAREIYVAWKRTRKPDPIDLANRITAALIEARRAALEEAASKLDGDLHLQDSEMRGYSRSSAARIRALIPTRPDGAAEGADCLHRHAINGRCIACGEDLPMWHTLTPEALMAAYDAEILSRGIPPTDIPEYRASRLSLCAGTIARLKL